MNPRSQSYRVYSPNQSPKQLKKGSHPIKPLLVLVVVCLCLGMYFMNARHTAAQNAQRAERIAAIAEKQQKKTILSKRIDEILLENKEIKVSISLADISGGSTSSFGDSGAMDAASTAKLITACLYLKNVENGKYSLSQKIEGTSAKNQLRRLIQQSDDEAWSLFNERLGHSALETYTRSLGINSYDPETGFIAPSDMTLLLKKLYQGKLLHAAHTKLLLSYMQNTNYEEYISPAVDDGAIIYHKVGLTGDQVNDTAIVSKNDKAYALTIFSNGDGTYDWPARAEMMQAITKAASAAYL